MDKNNKCLREVSLVPGNCQVISVVKNTYLRPIIQPLPRTLRNAARRPLRKEILIIFIELSSGKLGIGECWTAGIGIETLTNVINTRLIPAITAKTTEQARHILQMHLEQAIEEDNEAHASAISGLDCALWVAEAKNKNIPLYQLLGGKHEPVYSYASGGLYDDNKKLNDLADDARGFIAKGFDAIKIKVGGASIKEDVARVRAVRQAIGHDKKLMIDANGALSTEDALTLSEQIKDQDIYWFEEPCLEGLADLKEKCKIPICGYERRVGRQSFMDLIVPGLLDHVQFDLSICGGITEGLEILTVSGRLPISLHGSSSVALYLTNLHFATAFRAIKSVEFHMVHQWSLANMEGHKFNVKDGLTKVSNKPGIGFDLKPSDMP